MNVLSVKGGRRLQNAQWAYQAVLVENRVIVLTVATLFGKAELTVGGTQARRSRHQLIANKERTNEPSKVKTGYGSRIELFRDDLFDGALEKPKETIVKIITTLVEEKISRAIASHERSLK